MEQYLYKLKLKPQYLQEENWTDKENEIVQRHFMRLKDLTEKGTVILAGRTLNEDETQFGIVIIEVESEQEAQKLMEDDPAVSEGVMDSALYPYQVALMRE